MEMFNEWLVQLGGVGLMLVILIVFSRYLFSYVMQQVKENAEENKRLENKFRDYLMDESKRNYEVIANNTKTFENLADFFNHKYTEYFDEKVKEQKGLNEAILEALKNQRTLFEMLIKKLKGNN